MRKLTLAALYFLLTGAVQAQNLRIVNAASLTDVSVAPGSIVSIFGTNLTTGVAFADSAQHPPTSLGGVSVTIGGTAAALFYVSPTQINAVVDPATAPGTDNVVVTSSSGTQTGSVTVSTTAAPGLFSLLGTGTRDGAIINAATFLLGDFSTTTANSPTFLALFATGVTASPSVIIAGVDVTVQFFGPAPCCDGLQQINVALPQSLAGAGRVPVVVTANGQVSNVVQIVLLPPASQQEFPGDQANQKRSRELASLAYVPGSSLVISTDENDDVVRVIDVSSRQVTDVIALPQGAAPVGVAVNAAGTLAVVAESNRGKAAILDLTKFSVITEVATGGGPVAVAIGGTQAVVVNTDDGTVSIIDLTAGALQRTVAVGRGPAGVAIDPVGKKAYVTNEDDGTVSVVDLSALTVAAPFSLGANVRPESIALTGFGTALITAPAAGPNGQVLVLDLTTGNVVTTLQANPDRSGGSTAVAIYNSKAYFANQAGGSVTVLPLDSSGAPAGAITTIRVGLGARALAIDAKDNLLVVSNEGTGTLVLIDLASNTVAGRINAVRTNLPGDDNGDDHSDHNGAPNMPVIKSISPSSAKAGDTIAVTISGANLAGAAAVQFFRGNQPDGAFTASKIAVSTDGTQLTATVAIDASARSGARSVRVLTPNGEASGNPGPVMFTVAH